MPDSNPIVANPTFHFPMDIIIDILSRLPVKTLIRFASVCKTWYALIKSPTFISEHLNQHTLDPKVSASSLLVFTSKRGAVGFRLSLYLDALRKPVNVDFPFLRKGYFSVAGVCNGLLCICLSYNKCNFVLCNPATRQFRKIPQCNSDTDVASLTLGFAFHPSADDYKLMRIEDCYNDLGPFVRAKMYTMSTDDWREIDIQLPLISSGEVDFVGHFVAVNGILYWMANISSSNNLSIVSFDMGDEVFRVIESPRCFHEMENRNYWQMTNFIGKLALIRIDKRCFDIWILNEDGISWTKELRVGPLPCLGAIRVLGCAKNGDFVVGDRVDRDVILLYELESCETKCLPYLNSAHRIFSYKLQSLQFYSESLLPVKKNEEV